ncbi:universal stress protein [Streptomyces sp. CRN 30]|uniref:universal stress protein n=1 Tax=Streptomyces sp. CRN 30 TaxID=3075613 RepID=UPI002A7F6735|nr:universal stress protein [Streptomyces sp. CRN 30]
MPHNVTVGVDGSPAALAAAHWAAREARRRGTGLEIVHAWRPHPQPSPYVPLDFTEHGWAAALLREAVDSVRRAHGDVPVTDRLVRGATVDALIAAAAESEPLVLGSLGLSAIGGFVTGSVSQRAVARFPRPVVLVRAGQDAADEHLPPADGVAPEEIPATPYRQVVLGLDIGRPCDELIEFAFDAARRRSTGLRVVHAFKAPPQPASDATLTVAPAAPQLPVSGPRQLAAQERAVVAAVRPWGEKYPTVPVSETVVSGRAAGALVDAAGDAGLVVVGRRTGAGIPGSHVGPITHAVLHHVRCPVAVVPHA